MMNQFKVVHIASGDIWAGAEAQLFSLVKSIHRDSGTAVAVILFNHGILEEKLKSLGIEVYVIDEKNNNGIFILKKLIKILSKIKPQIVHTHGFKENILGAVATLFVKGAKSIRTEHGAPEFSSPFWVIHKYLVQKFDLFAGKYLQKRIIAVSKDLQEILTTVYPASQITLIENGIDIEQLIANSKENISLPSQTGEVINCALVCRLVDVKRPELVIQIANSLINEMSRQDVRFFIFGDGPLRESLSSLITAFKLNEYVHLMGFKANIAAYLAKMDICLITSDHEGLPINLLESMVLGVHVVSHAVGGIPAVLENGKHGTLVYEQDVKMYSNALQALIHNGLNRDNSRTFEYIKQKYSIKEVAQKYLELYKSVHTGNTLRTI